MADGIDPALRSAVGLIARVPQLLIACDYDGTLAPIVVDPEKAVVPDATRELLEALERNDISRLPGGIFSRAFVRSYAAEIGADPEQTVRDFLSQFPHDSVTVGSPHVIIDEGLRGQRRLDTRVVMILGTIVLVAAAILLWTLR